MNNENMMPEINEVVTTGTELVTEVAGNNDVLKKCGVVAVCFVAGAEMWDGGKRLYNFGKSKFKNRKAKKNENDKSETSDEKAETVEN